MQALPHAVFPPTPLAPSTRPPPSPTLPAPHAVFPPTPPAPAPRCRCHTAGANECACRGVGAQACKAGRSLQRHGPPSGSTALRGTGPHLLPETPPDAGSCGARMIPGASHTPCCALCSHGPRCLARRRTSCARSQARHKHSVDKSLAVPLRPAGGAQRQRVRGCGRMSLGTTAASARPSASPAASRPPACTHSAAAICSHADDRTRRRGQGGSAAAAAARAL